MSLTDAPMVEDDPTEPVPEPEPAPAAEDVRYCQLPECPNTVPEPEPGRGGAVRIYCDDHYGNTPQARKVRRQWLKDHGVSTRKDQPPRIAVDLGVGKSKGGDKGAATAAELAAVEQRARQIVQIAAALIMVGTKDERRMADAADLAGGAPGFAAATRDLAVYEPWLRILGAGGEVSDRAQAWGAFLLALATMTTPILVRHEVIKGGMAELAATILSNGESLNTTG